MNLLVGIVTERLTGDGVEFVGRRHDARSRGWWTKNATMMGERVTRLRTALDPASTPRSRCRRPPSVSRQPSLVSLHPLGISVSPVNMSLRPSLVRLAARPRRSAAALTEINYNPLLPPVDLVGPFVHVSSLLVR